MFSKLSLRNVKRSFKDYTIYFLTLVFGVCIFYMFNSIQSQSAVIKLSEMQSSMIESLSTVMGAVSVFVAFVIGFLIIYANKFLVRKRKKEMGLYISLGMSKRKVSTLLLLETLIIGIFALTVGLILGIGLSQGLAGLTAKMFSVDLTAYKFIFSSSALIKTVIYFGIMFLIVMIFNAFVVSKYKLIDLLNGDKKNESIKIKGKYQILISVIIFIISIICIGVAYYLILENGLLEINTIFYTSLALGVIGTFLFFFSLSGFLLKLIQSNKRIYLKNLNMFVLRQINSKVNTAFISMSIICLMLFFTIGILSTGFAMNTTMEKQIENSTPYDATLYSFQDETLDKPISETLKLYNLNINNYSNDYVEYYEYVTPLDFGAILKTSKDSSVSKNKYMTEGATASTIKLSDYNKLRKLKGEKPIKLKENETILVSDNDKIITTLNDYLKTHKTLNINEKNYTILEGKVIKEVLETTLGGGNLLTTILPDNAVNGFKVSKTVVSMNYKDPVLGEKAMQEKIKEIDKAFDHSQGDKSDEGTSLPYIMKDTRTSLEASIGGMKILFLYVGFYIGIVFLISSAAILAIQQLSEATDNVKRYEVLRKIGVSNSMANKSIFSQTFIYFMMPLSLAIVHSIVGIYVAKDFVSAFGDYDILLNSFVTALIICIIYGGYFVATYLGYKNVIKGK